ncbi:MAG: hypothetical protein IPI49_03540 [Myxococcales bacterium]|jgi:hypothetical protein|nr:hypothetical protein [Myxococcales bacterium]HRC54743.1 hypothetical protein [Kofleriaceae bacterium]
MLSKYLASPFRSRRFVVAIAALCVAGQAFALVHLFALHHVRCAEHGDLLHIEGEGARRDLDLAAELARETAAAVSASGLPFAAHQGDHCTALTERRDLRSAVAVVRWDLPPLASQGQPCWRTPDRTSRALYRLAPKISPPAAA